MWRVSYSNVIDDVSFRALERDCLRATNKNKQLTLFLLWSMKDHANWYRFKFSHTAKNIRERVGSMESVFEHKDKANSSTSGNSEQNDADGKS